MATDVERAHELIGKMLNLKLYVVHSRGKGLDSKPHLLDHLSYMLSLEKAGKLFASGPIGTPGSGNGMTILRVADEAEAFEIASQEPFVIAGLRDFTIETWHLMEGSLSVTLHLSDRSMRIG